MSASAQSLEKSMLLYSMRDYVLRRRKGVWIRVDKAIIEWRRQNKARLAKAMPQPEPVKPQLSAEEKRDLLKRAAFGGDE